MSESDDSVELLKRAFTTMMEYENEIYKAVDELPDVEDTKVIRNTIKHKTEKIAAEMQGAVMALQFYDKLSQRLSHVGSSIESLSKLVGDSARIHNPGAWLGTTAKD